MRWEFASRLGVYFDEDEEEYRRPIVERSYVWPDDLFDAHLYPKAAAMLHELRFIMGDEAFFKGIHAYITAFARSNAETYDFRKVMEKSSGQQLEEFFEQAFYKPGYPEFEVSYAWDDEAKVTSLNVKQVQRTEDGTPVFKLPCEIVFYVSGERRVFRVLLDSAQQTLAFSLPSAPSIVEFDPCSWLLKKVKFDKTRVLLLNQLERSQDASSRAEAATALGKMKSEEVIQGLKVAASTDPFWHVRACAFKALGEISTESALDAVLGAGVPSDRKTRRGMAAALGNYTEQRARDILVRLLGSDESPYVRCEAALSLAKAWPEGAFPHLKEGMSYRFGHDTVGEACIAAMGKLKDEEAKKAIIGALSYGRPTRVRIGATKAIKERGSILDEEVPVLKEMMRGDKEWRLRLQAVNELIRPLKDTRFVADVLYVSQRDNNKTIRRKALETYHELTAVAESSAALTKLRTEVEQLKEENKRLAAAGA